MSSSVESAERGGIDASPGNTVDAGPGTSRRGFTRRGPGRRVSRRSSAPRGRAKAAWIPVFVVVLLVSIPAACLVGTADIHYPQVVAILLRHLGMYTPASGAEASPLIDALIWESRLPRVLLAAVVGIGLSLSGAVLQAVTRNPLAEPYLLGVSSGASTGAVVVLLLGVGGGAISLSTGAFGGALVAFGIVLVLIGGGRTANASRVVLTGVLVSQFFSALTSLVLMLSGDADAARGFTFWLLGSLGGARWQPLLVATAVILPAAIGGMWLARVLDAFTFGWDTAASLGIPVARMRGILMVLAALMTAAAVAASGAIGFIGLLVPHIVRLLSGSTHRLMLPLTALGGAVFLIWVDTLARTVLAPHEIPVGVITALLGAPVFALVLRKENSR